MSLLIVLILLMISEAQLGLELEEMETERAEEEGHNPTQLLPRKSRRSSK